MAEIIGTEGTDVLAGTTGADSIRGLDGNDNISGDLGNDTLDGGAGADTMSGGLGDDTYILDNPDDQVIEFASEGTDEIRTSIGWGIGGTPDIENLTATGSDDFGLNGNAGNNVITGNSGNNYLVGEAGNDTIDGGTGTDDVASFQLPEGTVGSYRVVEGTGGFSGKLLVERVDGETVEVVFIVTVGASGSATVQGVGTAAFLGTDTVTNVDQLHFLPQGPFDENKFTTIDLTARHYGEWVSGGQTSEIINIGDYAGAINVEGRGGDDILNGTDANNYMTGGSGDDTISGGAGSGDIASYQFPSETVGTLRVVDGTGVDAGKLIVELVNGDVVEAVLKITLSGGGSATVEGVNSGAFLGTDTVSNVEDLHIFIQGGGSFVSVALAPIQYGDFVAGSEGSDIIDLANYAGATGANGNGGNDQVIGTDAVNNLNGGAGNDTLQGNGGDDYFEGNDGDDLIEGGDGNDYMISGAGNDTIDGGLGSGDGAIFRLPEGSLGALRIVPGTDENLGNFTVELVNGESVELVFNVTLTSEGALVQGVNSAAHLGTDTVVSVDRLEFSIEGVENSWVNIQNPWFGDEFNNNYFGWNDTNVAFGGDGYDALRGAGGNDALYGEAGNDFLVGGFGDDLIVGGDGFDRVGYYQTDSNFGGATVSLLLQGQWQDTGNQGFDFLMGVENVSGSPFADHITGDDGSNFLWGSGAFISAGNVSATNHDTISGGGGEDVIQVGIGNHVLDGGSGTDTVGFVESGLSQLGATVSLALQGVSQTTGMGDWLVTNVENLSGSSASDTFFGNNQANVLAGSGGDDLLAGAGGDDTLLGDGVIIQDHQGTGLSGPIATFITNGVGNDTLEGGEGNDQINGGFGIDTAVFTLPSGLTGSLVAVDGQGDDAGKLLVQRVDGDATETLFEIVVNGSTTTVTGVNSAAHLGTDNISAVENFRFVIGEAAEGSPQYLNIAAPAAFVPAGNDFLVSSPSEFSQTSPSIAVLSDGRLIMVWGSEDVADDTSPSIKAQMFDAGGAADGGEITLRADIANAESGPQVAAISGGDFVLVWSANVGTPEAPDGDIFTQRFDSTGAPVGDPVVVNNSSTDFQGSPDVIALSDGGYAISWIEEEDGDQLAVMVREYSADGAPGEASRVNQSGFATGTTLAALPNGGFIVSWGTYIEDAQNPSDIYARIYTENGTPVGDEFAVTGGWSGSQSGSSVAVLNDGKFVIVFEDEYGDGSGSCIVAQIYNSDGSTFGDSFVLNSTTDGFQEDPQVVATADGGFVVGYASVSSDETLSEIKAQAFNSAGQPVGSEFAVASGESDEVTASAFGSGFVVAWEREDDLTDIGEIRAQFFNASSNVAESEPILGTEGADSLVGTANNDLISALAGNDTIDGGAGADTMEGGLGNDVYIVDNAGDVVAEGSAAGTDEVQSSVSHALTANVERLVLKGSESINGTGNDLDNFILGNKGGNTLSAGLGNDTFAATSGADVLDGGDGFDGLNIIMSSADRFDAATGDRTYIITTNGVTDSSGTLNTVFSNVERLYLSTHGTGNFNNTIDASGFTPTGGGWLTLDLGDGNHIVTGSSAADYIFAGLGNHIINAGDGFDEVGVGLAAGATTTLAITDGVLSTVQNGVHTHAITNAEHVFLGFLGGSRMYEGQTGLIIDASDFDPSSGIQLFLIDSAGNDTMIGSSGTDWISSVSTLSGGTDVLTGGGGADVFDYIAAIGGFDGDTITDFDGDDVIDLTYNDGFAGDKMLANQFIGDADFSGVAGQYRYEQVNNQTLVHIDTDGDSVGDKTLTIANGTFALTETSPGSNILRIASGTFYGTDANNQIVASDGDDQVFAGAGDDWVLGQGGHDNLQGGAGNDIVEGGDGHDFVGGFGGNDFVYGNAGDDYVSGFDGDDYVDGGEGYDRTGYWHSTAEWGGVTVSLAIAGPQNTMLAGMDTLVSIEAVSGTPFADHITGDDNGNWLWGSGSYYGAVVVTDLQSTTNNDTISGGGGDDLIQVGIGNHVLDGGAGSDTLSGNENGAELSGVSISLALQGAAQDTGMGSWTISGFENLDGSVQADQLTGDESANILGGGFGSDTLVGGAGNDTLLGAGGGTLLTDGYAGPLGWMDTYGDASADYLDGGAGDDRMVGGAGDDVYVIDSFGDQVIENANEGMDEIRTSISWGIGGMPDIENLTATGSDNIGLNGNAGNNVIKGNSGDNYLVGEGGNDTIDGGTGTDDVASFQLPEGTVGSYQVVDGTGENAGKLLVERVDGETVELVFIVTVTGTGSAIVQGVGTAAHLGTDTVTNVDQLHFLPMGPFNEAQFAAINLTVRHYGGEWVTGTAADDVINVVEYAGAINVDGQGGNDILNGTEVNNYLVGGSGNDTINGGTGSQDVASYQLPAGTAGTLQVVDGLGEDAGKLIIELVNGETVEQVLKITLTGNGSAVIEGVNSGAFMGTDTVSNIDELHIFIQGEGGSFVGVNLSPVQFDEFVSGSENSDAINLADYPSAVNANGNRGNDSITGNDLNNSLQGAAGSDTLAGGLGNDTLVGGAEGDELLGGDGHDLLIGGFNSGFGYQPDDGADTLKGGSGNDTLRGGDGNDLLEGGDGNDNLRADAGSDTMDGGEGSDFVNWSFGALQNGVTFDARHIGGIGDTTIADPMGGTDTIRNVERFAVSGTNFNDVIYGSEHATGVVNAFYANQLLGGAGNDLLVGAGSYDGLSGGEGNDTLRGGGDTDVLWGDAGDDVLEGGGGDDWMIGSFGNDHYDGGDGADDIAFQLLAPAPVGTLRIVSGSQPNTWFVERVDGDTIEQLALLSLENGVITSTGLNSASYLGTDTFVGVERIIFDREYDGLYSPEAAVFVVDDVMNYAPQIGTAVGTLMASEGKTTEFIIPSDAFSDTDEGDTLTYSLELANGGALPAWISFDPATRVITVSANDTHGGVYDLRIVATDTSGETASQTISLNVADLIGGSGNDSLTGTAGADLLQGGAGNDSLVGFAGNDTLDGGTGADTMTGGDGNDIYFIDNAGDVLGWETETGGIDEIRTSLSSHAITGYFENLTYTGSSDFQGTGNRFDNLITGGVGDDRLDGGGGNDTLRGGAGNDTYVVDAAGDIVEEGLNAGTDHVEAHRSYTLTGNIENLTLMGTDAFIGRGNELNNVIKGNSGNNYIFGMDGNDLLEGGAGNDNLVGGAGNDTLDGGTGADTLDGGDGNDVYIIDNAGDSLGWETETGGIDEIRTSLSSHAISGYFENLTYTGSDNFQGTGNRLDNVITGGAGNDTLDGAAGVDTMRGGAGNDTYVINSMSDVIEEGASAGIDTVEAHNSFTLSGNIENLTLMGTDAFIGRGNELNNVIKGNSGNNYIFGMDGNDLLEGGAGNDNLVGGAGNDTLDGGTGADTLDGGDGNDVYIIDNAGDSLGWETETGGIDEIRTSLSSHAISGYFENLTYTGSDNFQGTGNRLDNVITGGAGNDTLDGAAGVDTMRGGAGNDTYVINSMSDVIEEGASAGIDTVEAHNSFTLSGNIENLTLMGTDAFIGRGNELNNVIKGNSGNNYIFGMDGNDLLEGGAGNDNLVGGAGNDTLDGGTGADTLDGGDGNDVYIIDNAGDSLGWETETGGIDEIRTSLSSHAISGYFENLTYTGSDNFQGTGNRLDNVITGGTGNDILSGGGGNDTLKGRSGSDNLTGGTGSDTFVFAGLDNGSDFVTDFLSGTDNIALDASSFGLSVGNGLTAEGELDLSFFVSGSGATATAVGHGQFVFDTATNSLLWDADGAGGEAGLVLATLNTSVALPDFTIIGG